ncbi:hypothetical protein [Streptomyces sp. SCUT-3]|uniref:hypothetical protein n=1 Tax=Streptomyces sp. SCUT-3 TaxID=2684469 RepID=UPI001C716BA9|nr:hypothetical protein [Streptomyces sp. SCUT-3]
MSVDGHSGGAGELGERREQVGAPLCGEAEFAGLVGELVLDTAPRLFAVVQEYGERVDARVAAWGLEFEDHAEIVEVDGGTRMRASSPVPAVRAFSRPPHVSVRLVRLEPSGAAVPG